MAIVVNVSGKAILKLNKGLVDGRVPKVLPNHLTGLNGNCGEPDAH